MSGQPIYDLFVIGGGSTGVGSRVTRLAVVIPSPWRK